MLNNYDIKYIIKRIIIAICIIFVMSFIKSCNVSAKTMNPRYATINSSYLWNDSKIVSANQLQYNIPAGGTSYVSYCISTSGADTDYTDQFYHHAQIDICTNSSSSWSLYSGSGYASVDGYVDFDNSSCSIAGYSGHIARVYVHLLDWTTPSGGADFSWSCFSTQQKNNSNYTTLNKILNIQVADNSNYETQKAEQDLIKQQNSTTNAINSQTQTQHQDSLNEQNAINQNTQAQNETNNILNNDNVSGAEGQVDSLLNNSAFNDSSGIQSIINAPLNFINSLSNSCSPIQVTIPYINSSVSIPCIKQELTTHVPTIVPILSTAINGFIIYRILIDIVYLIKSARNPDDDRIEVLDL